MTAATLLTELLPATAHSAEAFSDMPDLDLFPAEEAVVAHAVDKRRREFATVRHCARRALAAIGRPPAPLLPGERGAPGWPPGVVGSMTHCDGYRAAAIAEQSTLASLGIDAEPHAPLVEGILEAVSLPGERTHLASLSHHHPGRHWDRLLFSAKESVYKTWFPLTHRWLGFEEAEITFAPEDGTFRARLLTTPAGHPLHTLQGRWCIRRNLALTTLTHPA
ncbi:MULTISPECIES: 4'-phosphopantetheinyl transferase family protein [Streptomyces]|uniref:4'-phosphopantetheinyl transferase n=2 Tax=Streptomyces TaxID=1883 RepID=A0ABW7RJ41_9ACTN|nr:MULTISPECIES: 4'-phosphopantetheinyl transferase superfamily protein [Streptomyces]MYU53521.1 4'-phosphopantetheinyl transferase superfamily protein [Streptomyces sp. SID7805]